MFYSPPPERTQRFRFELHRLKVEIYTVYLEKYVDRYQLDVDQRPIVKYYRYQERETDVDY